MRQNVIIDAESIGDKAQSHNGQRPIERGKYLAGKQGHGQTAKTGEDALNNDDFHRAFTAEHFGAIIFHAPADAGPKDQQRALVPYKAALALKAEDDAGQSDQDDGQPKPSGEHLLEKKKRAMREVATISKLLMREALAELVCVNPSMRRMGAAISSATMATVKGSSFLVSGS